MNCLEVAMTMRTTRDTGEDSCTNSCEVVVLQYLEMTNLSGIGNRKCHYPSSLPTLNSTVGLEVCNGISLLDFEKWIRYIITLNF